MLHDQTPEHYPVKLEIEQPQLGGMFTVTITDNKGKKKVINRGIITMNDDPDAKAQASYVAFVHNVMKSLWDHVELTSQFACSCDEHGNPCVDIVEDEPVFAPSPQVIPIHQVQRYRMQ